MRYDEQNNIMLVSLKEFVTLARRKVASTLPFDDEEPTVTYADKIEEAGLSLPGKKDGISLSFTLGGIDYQLNTEAQFVDGNVVTLVRSLDGKPRKNDIAQTRGEAFVIGHALSKKENYERVHLKFVYINRQTGEEEETEEWVEREKLANFFASCSISVSLYGKPEVERVTERLPSMKACSFPYKDMRDGQDSLIRATYRTIARGTRLFATAPTGTGKTVSVLFPALRALGDGRCDKVFYLTPKTTTMKVAEGCIHDFAKNGVKVRAITLASKERCCKCGLVCREDRRLCQSAKSKKLADAVLDLFGLDKAVVTVEDLQEVAPKYLVCPHELGLAYSELCDVVICDLNYLFNPMVYIRRFFTEGGRFAFLVDEAHNLVERARECHSAEISTEELGILAEGGIYGEYSPFKEALKRAKEELYELLYPYLEESLTKDKDGVSIAATHLCEIPSRFYEIMGELDKATEVEFYSAEADKNDSALPRRRAIKEFSHKLANVNNSLQLFDDKFRMLIFLEGKNIRIKLFCLDTGGVVSGKLDKGSSAVLFSATLSPLSYYRDLLGGDGTSELLEVASPFAKEQVSVSIMDRISLRYSERERTLPAVCAAVAATMIPRKGNYMVFSPSFEYSSILCEMFKKKYPKLTVLCQEKDMTAAEKRAMLAEFEKERDGYLVGFCVMGGIYSEGIDLVGKSLIGTVVIGIGMPALSYEREAMRDYFESKYESGTQYAYIYPGMNRVFQAAGRVIRSENDRGVVVLIDDRFDDPIYKKSIPSLLKGMQYVEEHKVLKARIEEFWRGVDEEESRSNTDKI